MSAPLNYSVTIEYSVLVTPEDLEDGEELTPETAEEVARGWMSEPEHCNEILTVRRAGRVVRRVIDGVETT